jgi:nucleotide-binding universal stress UspA family protein
MGGPALQVIVGVDGSAQSVLALSWVCRRAQTCGDVIRAVCAWSLGASGEDWTSLPGAKAEGQQRAENALEAAVDLVRREQPSADIETLVVEGPAAHVLVQMSANADLLVVGSRGHGGFKELLLGSVSSQCVHHSRCPVTVVRHSDDGQVI